MYIFTNYILNKNNNNRNLLAFEITYSVSNIDTNSRLGKKSGKLESLQKRFLKMIYIIFVFLI